MGEAEKANNPSENEPVLQPKIEILTDLDNYQEKMESHWESAKAHYQDKVNQILDEFIHENIRQQKSEIPPSTPKGPSTTEPPKATKPAPDFSEPSAEERLARLLSRAEKVVRMADKKTHFNIPKGAFEQPAVAPFQLGWHTEPLWRKAWRMAKHFGLWLVIGAGFLIGAWFFMGVPTSYSLPYNHATGLVIDNNKIYVIDWFRKAIFVHQMKRGFPISSVENLPNQFMTGFARSANKVWSLDGLAHEFLSHSLTPEHLVIDRVKTPGKKPVGLYFDGTDLWSMDDESKMLYRHHANDLTDIKASYALPNMSVSGLAVRKNKVWVLSEKSRIIREFRLEDPVRELQTIDLDLFLEGANVTSFALDDHNMWLTTENPTKLLRIPLKKISR